MLYQNRNNTGEYVLASQHEAGSRESIRRIHEVLIGTDWVVVEVETTKKETWKKEGTPQLNVQAWSTFGGSEKSLYLKNKLSEKRVYVESFDWVVSDRKTRVVKVMTEKDFRKKYGESPLEIRNIRGYVHP